MKLMKHRAPVDVYVVTSRNGVRLSKPESGCGENEFETSDPRPDAEGLDVPHVSAERVDPAMELEPG